MRAMVDETRISFFFFFCQDSYASEALLIEGNVKLFYACLVSTYFLPLE